MSVDTNPAGEGRVWAVINAQEVMDLPFGQGMEACIEQAAKAADIHARSVFTGQPTQAKTCERLASSTGLIVEEWQKDGSLPVPHVDFGIDLHKQSFLTGKKRIIVNNFDPDAPRLSAASQRLRVVRMALPELLRQYRPTPESAQRPLKSLAEHLGKVCLPGQASHGRAPKYPRWVY